MITKETLRQIVVYQHEGLSTPKEIIPRELLSDAEQWLNDKRIIILTGIRRCGKSTLLRQIMQRQKNACYVNFEDERFIDFKAEDFEQLHEILIEVYGLSNVYCFDEIQNIDKFETFIRRLHDQGKKIFMTGSNATLLSKELGTKLTGRYKAIEVFPFSFREFLLFHKISPTKEWLYRTEKKVQLFRQFRSFFSQGGFPEYLLNNDQEYLRTIRDNILYRDIISRYAIKKQKILKELVNLLMTAIATPFTYNSLKVSLGLANSITVKEYISYLCNSYLFFEIPRFDFSVRRQLASPKKIYSIDQGMHHFTGFRFSENQGSILENIVFLELKRKGKEIYYYSGKRDCDFVIKEGAKISQAIQVCSVLNETSQEREIESLVEALSFFKLSRGIILTHEQEEEITAGGKIIKIIPVWKWLLEQN